MSLQVARGSALGSMPTAFKKMRDGGNGSLNGMIQKDAVGNLCIAPSKTGFLTKNKHDFQHSCSFEAVYELR